MEKQLTKREELFCQYYSSKPIGGEAAIKAGYAESSSRQVACKLLTNDHIKARLKELDAELYAKIGITKE